MNEKYFNGYLHEKIEDGFCANEGFVPRLVYKGEDIDFSRILKLYKMNGKWQEILPNIFYKHKRLEKKFGSFGRILDLNVK